MRSTIANINAAIKAEGLHAELCRGKDYFYFVGTSVEFAYSTMVLVPRLSDMTVPEWCAEASRMAKESLAEFLATRARRA